MSSLPATSSPLAVCSRLTHAISHTEDLVEIYGAALDALEGALQARRASILLFDPDGVMRFKAWRGLSEAYRAAVEGHTPWTPNARSAESIIVPDVSADPGLAPYLPTIRAEHIGAMAFIPLEATDGVIGKFMVYYDEPRQIAGDELQLAEMIAAQVAFAVQRTRAAVASNRLAAIVRSSDDAIVSKNLDGIIQSWNQGAERLFGYSASEAVGKSINLIIPDHLRSEEERVLGSIRSDRPVEMETVRRRKDGAYIDISLKVSPVKDATGRIVGASKIARDITARKRDEAERAELHRRLTILVEASATLLDSPEADAVRSATISLARQLLVADGYAVWAWNRDTHAWAVVKSEGISETFAGRVISSYRGAPASPSTSFAGPLAVQDVATLPMLEEQRESYRAEGIQSMLICPMRLGSGRGGTLVFYYRRPQVFSEMDLQTGQALANLGAAALTTAGLYDHQREQRNAAEVGRRRAAFLADATAVLTTSLDYEQTLAGVARLAVPEIADSCAVDLLGESGELKRVVSAPRDFDTVDGGAALRVVETGQPMLTPSCMSVPLLATSGTLGAMTFCYRVPGRRYTAQDLVFGQDVAARAALAIENAFAYRRASDANRLKDEFLATLSHELRTPLNAILGYAQMLNNGLLNVERQQRAISILTRNAEALRQIIDDVLDVSRITSGKLRLNVRPVALGEILKNAAATVQPAADAKGVALQWRIDGDVALVLGDPDRLQQVLWNLLSNAVKFTPRGGHVSLRLAQTDTAVELVVRDDGQGIDRAFLPHIFERFRQGDSRFSREHGGLGLGLAIVRDLVELHGGTVTAESDGPGTGATFVVRLPVSGP